MNAQLQRIAGGFAAALAVMMLAGPALADGMQRSSLKDTPKPEERCKHSANIALTTEYVFRGFSQTAQGPAVQGGYRPHLRHLLCGRVGLEPRFRRRLARRQFRRNGRPLRCQHRDGLVHRHQAGHRQGSPGTSASSTTAIPTDLTRGLDLNYLELKVGASAEIWKDGTLGVTVFWSPEYQLESGSTWTVETGFTQVFPKFNALHRDWTPSFSALLGWQINEGNDSYKFTYGNGDDTTSTGTSALRSASWRSGRSTSATGTRT